MFGVHLLLRGWLLFKAGYMKKLLGAVMLIVAVSYLIDGFCQILISGYDSPIMSIYVGWLEALLPVWLIMKGRKVEAWAMLTQPPLSDGCTPYLQK